MPWQTAGREGGPQSQVRWDAESDGGLRVHELCLLQLPFLGGTGGMSLGVNAGIRMHHLADPQHILEGSEVPGHDFLARLAKEFRDTCSEHTARRVVPHLHDDL